MTLDAFRNKALLLLIASTLLLAGCARVQRPTSTFMTPSGAGVTHVVTKGQTLYRISKMYGVSVNDLMRANSISHPSNLEVGTRLFIPRTVQTVQVQPRLVSTPDIERVRRIVGSKRIGSDWRTITIHHSGTDQGNARLFDRDHRRRKMGGLFYHFVIGNGSDSGDGEIEVGFRWQKQVPANRPYDIQICLVGNFDNGQPDEAEFRATVNLTKVLMQQYNIPISSVRQHRDIPGKKTDCPGLRFPFHRLLQEVSRP